MDLYSWGDSRRFNSYVGYFKRLFGERVQKLTINAGFTCPNRDGTVGWCGCTYCDNDAFNPSYCTPEKNIGQQIAEGIEFHAKRYRRANKFLAYFQAFSNTHAPLHRLERLYNEALEHPQVIGLVIGTRPDCVDNEKLDYLARLSEKYYIMLEYGIESCYDNTLKRINRCHTVDCAVTALRNTAERGIKTGAHFIFGLPGESLDDMLAQANIISNLPLNTVKFHQLQMVKGTKMALEFEQNPHDFHQFTVDEYINFFTRFVERLNPEIVIERFAGEVPPRYLTQQKWGLLRNDQLLTMFEKRLEELNTYQGKKFNTAFK